MRAVFALLLAMGCAAAAAQDGEWSGTYRCGPMKSDPETRPGFSSPAKLTVRDGAATISRQSERVRESMSGSVGADGRVALDGTGQLREGGSTWRYKFEGRFEGNKFEASGAMYPTRGGPAIRDCTMTLTQTAGARPAKAAAVEKKEEKKETAVEKKPPAPAPPPEPPPVAKKAEKPPAAQLEPAGPPPAPAPAPREAETAKPAESVPITQSVRAALQSAAAGATEATRAFLGRYSQSDLILLAIFAVCAIVGVAFLVYDWRRNHNPFR